MSPSKPSYRGIRKGPRGPFQALFNLSGPPPATGSGGPLQHQHLFQVVAYPLQPEVTSIAHPAHITTALHPIVALQRAENPFHGPADPRIEFIPPLLLLGYGAITPGAINDATEHPPASQRLLAGIFGIGSIGKDRSFIAHDHVFEPMRLGDANRRLTRYFNMLNCFLLCSVTFFQSIFAEVSSRNQTSGTGVSPVQAQAKACGYKK
jgi:hypothetical protein